MQKRLGRLCALAAGLTAIALIPGILVPAAFMGGFPAIVLILAPYALLFGVALLIGDLRSRGSSSRKWAIAALVMVGTFLLLTVAATTCNLQLKREVQALTREDHDQHAMLAGTRQIAIQFVSNGRARSKRELAEESGEVAPGVVPPPARKQFCERLCLHLLLNGDADSVIVSTVSVNEGDPAPSDMEAIGMRFHLERTACRNPAVYTDDTVAPPYRIFEREAETGFANAVSARMVAGDCVVGEPARLSEAQVIVQENPFALPAQNGSNRPSMKNALRLYLAPVRAARLSIYQVQEGQAQEVFRQTQVEAYPLLPVLLLGPVATGEGGIGITEGLLRRQHAYSEYNLRDVLETKLGITFAPITK